MMGTFVINLLLSVLTSDLAKTVIAIAINKLLEHKSDGITGDIAQVMIDGIAKSKANPTTVDAFKEATILLKTVKV